MKAPSHSPDHGALEAARHGITRSKDWPKVAKEHLKQRTRAGSRRRPTASSPWTK